MPKISLVIPVYGTEPYIQDLLDSIRAQTFKDFEAIFVDDGSKDNCPQILDAFCAEADNYIVIHQVNQGVSVARNTGIQAASGEYLYIIDSDDWLEPTALESLWDTVIMNDADVIYGDYYNESPDGPLLYRPFAEEFFSDDAAVVDKIQFAINSNGYRLKKFAKEYPHIIHFGGAPWRYMVRTSIVKDNDLSFDPTVNGVGDDILFSLYLYEYVKSVAYVHQAIYHYRIVENSYTHGFKPGYLTNLELILHQHQAFIDRYHKDQTYLQSFYLRVFLYIDLGMDCYFVNERNPLSKRAVFKEFKALMHTEPYLSAYRNISLDLFVNRYMDLMLFLFHLGLFRAYRLMYTIIYGRHKRRKPTGQEN